MGLALPKRMNGGGGIRPPAEFADAVELYARRRDRTGTLKFVPWPVNCWVVEFGLRSNDPRMALWKMGAAAEPPTDVVYLWRDATPLEIARAKGRPHMVGYKLDELGVSGMLAFLERTDLASGRGEFNSLKQAMDEQDFKQQKAGEKAESNARQESRDVAEDMRRQILGIPYHTVGIEFGSKETPTPASTKE